MQFFFYFFAFIICFSHAEPLVLPLRSRYHVLHSNSIYRKLKTEWLENIQQYTINTEQAAILICDMWNNYWCKTALERIHVLAEKINIVTNIARNKGMKIIHSPSGCMDYYDSFRQRQKLKNISKYVSVPFSPVWLLNFPYQCDNICDDEPPCIWCINFFKEHSAIKIEEQDVISDNAEEIFNFIMQNNIKYLFFVGVHINMCVLCRQFGIANMTRLGVQCILIRDLTDSNYVPLFYPFVSQQEGTTLAIEYTEKYYCPSITSYDITHESENLPSYQTRVMTSCRNSINAYTFLYKLSRHFPYLKEKYFVLPIPRSTNVITNAIYNYHKANNTGNPLSLKKNPKVNR